jgi:hypothetical protein
MHVRINHALVIFGLAAVACGRRDDVSLRPSQDAALQATPGVREVAEQLRFSERPEGIIYDPPPSLARPDSAAMATPAGRDSTPQGRG